MKNTMLLLKNLSNIYLSRKHGLFGKQKVKPVLNNVNLEIFKGEIFGLAGESGCGKTTLCRCILGLIDYSGEIYINNKLLDTRREFAKKINYEVGAVFQDPGAALNPVKKTGWLMEEPLYLHTKCTKKERQKLSDEMLNLVGLDSSYRNRLPAELSSGQKQRVSIGSALMLRPSLLIADEPLSALDAFNSAEIVKLFKELNENTGITILLVSHNTKLIDHLCSRSALMQQGKLI